MKLKQLLLIVCLLACCIVRSQSQLTAFEDYEKCYAGFTNLDGDTIFKPQFNSVQYQNVKSRSSAIGYWYVKAGDYSGVLSGAGEVLIDWIYDDVRVRYGFDSIFTTTNNGKVGLIDLSRGRKVEPQFQSISFKKWSDFIEVKKETYFGLLDSNYNTVLPTEYQVIEEVYDKAPLVRSFMVCKEGRCGMLNIDGAVRIPLLYKTIKPIKFDRFCGISKVHYKVTNEGGKYGYLGESGDTIVPIKYDKGNLLELMTDTCSDQNLTIALMTLNYKTTAYNIGKKTVSKTYHGLWYHEGLLVYQDKWHNGVLDGDFNPLIEFDNGRLSTTREEQMERYHNTDYQVSPKNRRLGGFIRKDSLIFHVRPKDERWRFGRAKMFREGERALVNYYTGKSTPLDYEYLYAKYVGEDTLYWAVDCNGLMVEDYKQNKKEIPVNLHIYNDQLELINSISYVKDEYDKVRSEDAILVEEKNLVFLQNAEHKFGAVNSYGETKIEFEYDSHTAFTLLGEDYITTDGNGEFRSSRTSELVHIYEKDNKFGLINSSAEIVLPFIYDKIGKGFGPNAVIGDTTFRYSMNNFKVPWDTLVKLPEEKKKIPEVKSSEEEARSYSREEPQKEVPYADRFKIKEGFLYYEYKGFVQLMDSSAYHTGLKVNSIVQTYLVNYEGRILFNESHGLQTYGQTHFYFHENEVKILDYEGNVLEQLRGSSFCGTYNDHVIANIGRRKYGIYNYRTQQWTKSFTNYGAMRAIKGTDENGQLFWVQSTKQKNGQPDWTIVNAANERQFPYHLNQPELPVYLLEDGSKIVKSGVLFGVLNPNYEMTIPPVYDYILQKDSVYYLYKDSKWKIQCGKYLSKEQFDFVSNEHFKNGFVVFKDDKMAVLNNKLEFILPFTSKEDVISNHNLYKLLNFDFYEIRSKFGFSISEEPSNNEIVFVNRNIWRSCRDESTDGLFTQPFVFKKKQKPSSEMYRNYTHCQKEIVSSVLYFDGLYVSELVKLFTNTSGPESALFDRAPTRNFYTYKIENGTVIQLSLTDLLVDGGEAKLDKLITNELNKRQVFGVNCVDLPSRIETIKSRFQLSRLGLRFVNVGESNHWITISYEDLEGILKLD